MAEVVRVWGLTVEQLRVAIQTADYHDPGWRDRAQPAEPETERLPSGIHPGYWHQGHYRAAQPAAPETERLRDEIADRYVEHALSEVGRADIEAGDAQPAAPETEPFWNRRWSVFEDEDGRFCIVTEDDAAEYVVWPEMNERDVRRVVDAHNTVLGVARQPAAPETERLREALDEVVDRWAGAGLLYIPAIDDPNRPRAFCAELLRAAIEAGDK